MRIALASSNPGKLRELRAAWPDWQVEALDTTGIGEETGATFLENARAKAAFARERAAPDAWALGEDSGLEVDGLGGAPGVRSARFAGPGATDEANVERLLADLAGVEGEGRRARYVCELVLIAPDGSEYRGRGTLEGWIAYAPTGAGGFGYDPVFVPDGETETVGVLGDDWKAAHSHRARAARALREAVEAAAAGPAPGAGARARPRASASVSRSMDPAQALADLTEISPQIESAVLLDASGAVLASTFEDPERAQRTARAARELLAAAESAMGGVEGREPLVQLQAQTPAGCVFLVRDGERMVAAVTVPDPTVGLVFYDLKTCLRHVAGEELAPKPKGRAGSSAAAERSEPEGEGGVEA